MSRDFEDLGGRDPHQVIGVPPGAGTTEINRRFRQRLRRTHPDAGGDHHEQVMLNLARDILLDPVRLRNYLQQRREADGGPAVEDPPEAGHQYDDPFEWDMGAGPSNSDTYRTPPDPAAYPDPEIFEPTLADIHYPPPPRVPFPGGYRPPMPPYPPPGYVPRRRWSVLAFVSLALSLCFPLVGVILGVVALTQIHRKRERGSVIAWLAIALSITMLTAGLSQLYASFIGPPDLPTPSMSGSSHSTP